MPTSVPDDPLSDWLTTSRPSDTAELEDIAQALEAELPLTVEIDVTADEGTTELTPMDVEIHEDSSESVNRRHALIAQLRENPVDAANLRALAEVFDASADGQRAHLMREIADAVIAEADVDAPKLQTVLTVIHRKWLRHPMLDGECFALLRLAAPALKTMFFRKAKPRPLLDDVVIAETESIGRVVDVILAAIRTLGGPAPTIVFSERERAPISVGLGDGPEIVVARSAIDASASDAHLRFWAGSAMMARTMDLALASTLSTSQLIEGFSQVVDAVFGRGAPSNIHRVRDAVGPQAIDRLRTLSTQVDIGRDIPSLSLAARHSRNRAGLVVSGSIGAALTVVRSHRESDEEVVELVRFAASERHFQMRSALPLIALHEPVLVKQRV